MFTYVHIDIKEDGNQYKIFFLTEMSLLNRLLMNNVLKLYKLFFSLFSYTKIVVVYPFCDSHVSVTALYNLDEQIGGFISNAN